MFPYFEVKFRKRSELDLQKRLSKPSFGLLLNSGYHVRNNYSRIQRLANCGIGPCKLALNTGFEVVESLIKSNPTLKTDVAELKKTIAGNTKTIQTAANKVSELKTTVENLNKRLTKLEVNK